MLYGFYGLPQSAVAMNLDLRLLFDNHVLVVSHIHSYGDSIVIASAPTLTRTRDGSMAKKRQKPSDENAASSRIKTSSDTTSSHVTTSSDTRSSRTSPQELRWGDISVKESLDFHTECEIHLAKLKRLLMHAKTETLHVDGYTQLGRATKFLRTFTGYVQDALEKAELEAHLDANRTQRG